MYTAQRFLYDNLLETATLSATQQPGMVSGVQTDYVNNGETATLSAYGLYTGNDDLIYTVEATGAYVGGTPVYRWRRSSTTLGSWNAENVACPTSYTQIENGIYLKFSAAPTTGGRWKFHVVPSFGVANLLIRDRRKAYRTILDATTATLSAAFTAAVSATCCAIYDTNLTAAATVTLKGNATDSGWETPDFSVVFPASTPVIYFAAESHQYWRVEISDATTTADYLEIGEWYLGTYLQMSAVMDWRSTSGISYATQGEASQQSVVSEQRRVKMDLSLRRNVDIDLILAMLAAIHDPATRRKRPVFFHEFTDEPSRFFLGHVSSTLEAAYEHLDRSSFELLVEELPKFYV